MVARETENNAYANFRVTNKEHYGMLWYFLKWAIRYSQKIGLELPKMLSSFSPARSWNELPTDHRFQRSTVD